MGKSYTPRNRIEIKSNTWSYANGHWTTKWDTYLPHGRFEKGKWSDKRLSEYVEMIGRSFEVGGTNEHISKALGFIPYPIEARVVDQFTGEVKAQWNPGPFVAW